MQDDAFVFTTGIAIGIVIGLIAMAVILHPWTPASNMECNPGYHAVQTSNELHHRWYNCNPITP